jgi:ADP-ribosylglycohydrolase
MSLDKKKFKACMILAGLGDVIGFNNGIYEFNNSNEFSINTIGNNYIDEGSNYSNYIIFDFINTCGFYNCPLPNMTISDDTIFHISIAKSLIEFDGNCDGDNLLANIENNMIKEINTTDKITDMINKYGIGNVTLNSLKKLKSGDKWLKFPYKEQDGGTGGCMRTMCIGLIYPNINQREKLIKLALLSTRITHNNAIAWLGAITSALFVSLAVSNIEPSNWIFELISLLESTIIDNIVEENIPNDYVNYIKDKKIFIDKWKKYQQIRFDKYKFREIKLMMFPNYRSKFYHEMFSFNKNRIYPGAGGDDSVIIAYDALLDAKDNWEKLVVYSMLHVGDSDTTGTIAGAFYGATYGITNIAKIMTKKFNMTSELSNIGSQLYDTSIKLSKN